MREQSLHYLSELITAPSPSGFEGAAARVYRDYVGPLADHVVTDLHGNVSTVINAHADPRIMLSGHMDEIGFIVHYIDDNGLLYFSPAGGHDNPVHSAGWCGCMAGKGCRARSGGHW